MRNSYKGFFLYKAGRKNVKIAGVKPWHFTSMGDAAEFINKNGLNSENYLLRATSEIIREKEKLLRKECEKMVIEFISKASKGRGYIDCEKLNYKINDRRVKRISIDGSTVNLTISRGSVSVKEDMKNVELLELSGLLEEIFNNILSV